MQRNQAPQSFISAVSGIFSPTSSNARKNDSTSVAYRTGSFSSLSSASGSQNSLDIDHIEFEDCKSISSDTEDMPAPNSHQPEGDDVPNDSQARPDTNINDVIDAVNALHNKMAACGQSFDIKLPQIAVVGPESSGKSSVLQSFVGKDFLPNGAGLKTRRPTVIQLIPIHEGEDYGVFAHLHKEGEAVKKFFDFNAIRQEIEDETDRTLAPECFSSDPIHLTIYSTKVLKLTLVDLPGLVKNVLQGQEQSSVNTVREMVLEYIRDPTTIILAICNANQPISTADALQIAFEVDPLRERTIGVLTKLDLMDPGTNALDVLENRKLALKRGYVGVVNRSQLDIDNNVDMATVAENEKRFFQQPIYRHLAYRMGTQYLQKMLQKTLRQHIKNELPTIREDLNLRLSRLRRELSKFEEKLGATENGDHFYLMRYVYDFIQNVNSEILGYSINDTDTNREVASGAYMNYVLNTEVRKFITMEMEPDDRDLAILIANLCGLRNSISVPSLSIDALCKKLVCKFKDPLEIILEKTRQILLESSLASTQIMDKYPSLKNEVIYRVRCCIKNLTEETRDKLISHIDAEMFYVNTGHQDFDETECSAIAPTAGCVQTWKKESAEASGSSNGTSATNGIANGGLPSKEDLVTALLQNETSQKRRDYVKQVMSRYLRIVKKSVADVAIKYISYFLVKQFLDFLGRNLVTEILRETNLQNLMKDCEDDKREKQEMEATCKYLEEALHLIQQF